MPKQAVWVPGYVAADQNVGGGGIGSSDGPLRNFDFELHVPEHDYQDIVGHRVGSGVRFRGKRDRSVWFHFPIPTPVIFRGSTRDERARLSAVFVMWRTDGGSRVKSVHVWDGAKDRLMTHDLDAFGDFSGGTGQPGSHPKLVPDRNAFTVGGDPPVFYGVGVSVLVQFPAGSDNGVITFTSAGADFITP